MGGLPRAGLISLRLDGTDIPQAASVLEQLILIMLVHPAFDDDVFVILGSPLVSGMSFYETTVKENGQYSHRTIPMVNHTQSAFLDRATCDEL